MSRLSLPLLAALFAAPAIATAADAPAKAPMATAPMATAPMTKDDSHMAMEKPCKAPAGGQMAKAEPAHDCMAAPTASDKMKSDDPMASHPMPAKH